VGLIIEVAYGSQGTAEFIHELKRHATYSKDSNAGEEDGSAGLFQEAGGSLF
jgi:hypothetical protein